MDRLRRHAIDLLRDEPTLTKENAPIDILSFSPLPDGMTFLLNIVAKGEFRTPETDALYGYLRPEDIRLRCASLLIRLLFSSSSDPFRTLGLEPGAGVDEIRENKRLLLQWLHPDRNGRPDECKYFATVIDASRLIDRMQRRAGQPTPRIRSPHTDGSLGARERRSYGNFPNRSSHHANRRVAGLHRVAARRTFGVTLTVLLTSIFLAGLTTWLSTSDTPASAQSVAHSNSK